MPYSTLVSGTTITAAWGNANVRDQVVTPFATAAARSSAITSPVEGMLSYRADGDIFEGYVNSGWVAIPTDVQFSYCTADKSVTSSTATQTPNGMNFLAVATGAYIVDLTLFYAAGGTGDFTPIWSLPAGATIRHAPINVPATILTAGDVDCNVVMHQDTTANPGVNMTFGGANTAPGTLAKLFAYVKTTGTAGTVQFAFHQSVSDATATTLHEGSWLWAKRVA